MYENFYSFTDKPFNTTPDPKYFFPSTKHAEALNSLIYAINEKKGFVVITGEIGAGKTTICRTLLNKLDKNTKVAIITNTHLTCKELIAEILEEFEIEHKSGTKQKLLTHLNEFLINQLASDTKVVLIIDEAQNLAPSVLEEVRMLSNLETEKEKLIQIILMGQPQLKAKLEHPRLAQFKQRIAVYFHLVALTKEETQEYIRHRLKLAGCRQGNIFTQDAVSKIYEYAQGIPRLINLICDSALLSGYVYDTKIISGDIIAEAIKEREFNDLPAGAQEGIPSQVNAAMEFSCPEKTKAAEEEITGSLDGAEAAAEGFVCCEDCQDYLHCDTKWIRGTRGERQFCCPSCRNFGKCHTNKTQKLNSNSQTEERWES